MSTSSPIVLATGHITAADELSIQLVEPAASPSVILIVWPARATPVALTVRRLCRQDHALPGPVLC